MGFEGVKIILACFRDDEHFFVCFQLSCSSLLPVFLTLVEIAEAEVEVEAIDAEETVAGKGKFSLDCIDISSPLWGTKSEKDTDQIV